MNFVGDLPAVGGQRRRRGRGARLRTRARGCGGRLSLGAGHAILQQVHCKKRLAGFPSPAGMSLTEFSLAGNNLINPGQGEFGAGLGTEKPPLTFFYSVSIEDVDSSLMGTDRARTFKLLRSLDSKESIPPAYVA